MYNPYYYYSPTHIEVDKWVWIVALVVGGAIALTLGILELVGTWKTFKKAGLRGWEALIPFYNTYCMVRIAGLELWWFVIMMAMTVVSMTVTSGWDMNGEYYNHDGAWAVGIAVLVLVGAINFRIAKSFGRSKGFAVGMTLLPFVFWMILGTGKDKYAGPAGPYVMKPIAAKGKK